MKEVRALDHSVRFEKQAEPLYRRARKNLDKLNRRQAERRERLFDEGDVKWLEARLWMQGKPLDLDHYACLFSQGDGRLTGDISPRYALVPDETAAAVRARFPEARILYLARDPVSRFWSNYCMVARRRPIDNADDLAAVVDFAENGPAAAYSRIREAVRRWRLDGEDARFGLFFFDDLAADAGQLLIDILKFIGAPNPTTPPELQADFNRKSAQAKIAMTDDVRAYLVDLFSEEILGCAEELGGPAAAWPAKYGL